MFSANRIFVHLFVLFLILFCRCFYQYYKERNGRYFSNPSLKVFKQNKMFGTFPVVEEKK